MASSFYVLLVEEQTQVGAADNKPRQDGGVPGCVLHLNYLKIILKLEDCRGRRVLWHSVIAVLADGESGVCVVCKEVRLG